MNVTPGSRMSPSTWGRHWEVGHHAEDTRQRDALQSLADALSQSREQTMAYERLPSWV
jgi:hypothetical protein